MLEGEAVATGEGEAEGEDMRINTLLSGKRECVQDPDTTARADVQRTEEVASEKA